MDITTNNTIIGDPLKQDLLNDKVADFIFEKVMRDQLYIENLFLFESGRITREYLIKIIIELSVKYKNSLN